MAELQSPFDGGAIDVDESLVDRYVAAGWVKPEAKKAPAKKSAAKKTADKPSDENN